ncbi:MAG: radical SAM protein [Phycisphaerae bacterium]|nr:radical SAM protein [Phycisphaerae bacterium]
MKTDTDLDLLFDRWKERIERLIREHPLQIISWEATRRCNMNCVHCGSPSENVNLDEELTTDEVVSAFDQIATDFDMSRFRHINITGGEPFVRKDLLEILSRISRSPFYRNIDIQTNGLILYDNPELFDCLKRYGVTGLGISIDGLETTHDSFRRIRGSFSKAFEAAKIAVENGYITTISTVAHSNNVVELPELFNLVRAKIQPRVFRVMTIDPIGRAEFDSEYLLSAEDVRSVIEFLRAEYQDSCGNYADPSTTMVELGCGGWLGRELEGICRPLIFHCIAGITNLGILFDGKIASCSNVPRDFIEGDLRIDRIRTVWEARYHRYRNFEWRRVGPCAVCDEWDYCHGGPMHNRRADDRISHCLFHGALARRDP